MDDIRAKFWEGYEIWIKDYGLPFLEEAIEKTNPAYAEDIEYYYNPDEPYYGFEEIYIDAYADFLVNCEEIKKYSPYKVLLESYNTYKKILDLYRSKRR